MASLPYPRSHQTIFPQNPTQPNHLCASVKSVGSSSTPEISVNSVNSVGGLAEGGVGMAGMPYPPNLWASVKSVGGSSTPEASVCSVNSVGGLAEGGVGMAGMPYPPTKTPTDCTDVHRLGAKTQPKDLWASVKSVGEYSTPETSVSICEIRGRISSARSFREFCEFCGRIGRGRRGYGRMPYPPTKTPTDCTDVHRLGSNNAT